jgi:hypothetical protein
VYRLKNGGDGSSDPDSDGGANWELIPTQAQVDAKADQADQATTYTETEVDGLLDAKADQATTYTETEVDNLLDDKANISGQIFTGEINYRGAGGGTTNTGYGENVLQNNTTGDNNTANGRGTLYNNTEGSDNTANGRDALQNNTTGNENTANGRGALYNNTEGNENTANGYNAGFGIETGSGNSIFGANVTGLAPDLTDNLILASGGVIRLQHDGVGTTTVQGDLVAENLSGTNTGDGVLAIGVGQTWQDVSNSRTQDVNYTNTTSAPIFVSIYRNTGDSGVSRSMKIIVDGISVAKSDVGANEGENDATVSAIVPVGSVYEVVLSGLVLGSNAFWTELR